MNKRLQIIAITLFSESSHPTGECCSVKFSIHFKTKWTCLQQTVRSCNTHWRTSQYRQYRVESNSLARGTHFRVMCTTLWAPFAIGNPSPNQKFGH